MPKVVNLKILGEVQNVNLRFDASRYARQYKLKGWIRNESNGSVRCCLVGDDQEIANFISWLKSCFRISSVEADEMEIDAEYNGFEIRY
ncbi:acylphosphatase [Patescibacteria group bacterium]|nr:acylphosphatase [Patescibacteria group bacterium]